MKVNQIVGEHKKGYRANIYRKKKVIAPQSTEIKPMEEDAKITKSDQSGVEITADTGIKTVLPADKATALAPDPQNPNEYDLNPAAVNPGDSGTSGPTAPKVGASVEMKTAEDGNQELMTMPTDEYVKGIYAAAAENGMAAPEAEAVKKQMVLAPNGEVDIIATMQKAAQVFQSPEWKQMLADLDALVKQGEAQQPNPELARIQELAGMTDEDVRLGDFTQHDNGDTSYSAGPLSVRKSKDGSTDMSATIGDTTARIQQNPIGVRTMTAQGSAADAISSVDASASRKGVDPDKFAKFQQQLEQTPALTKPDPTKSGSPMSFDDLVKTVQQGGKVNATAPEPTPQQNLDQYKKDYMNRWNALSPEEKARSNQMERVSEQRSADNQLLAKMLSIAGLK